MSPPPIDTLPPAEIDDTVYFEGWHTQERTSYVRMRVYHTTEGTPLIVLSDPRQSDSGLSVTNGAERCQYLAWCRMACAWPCLFVEHYPGLGEHWAKNDPMFQEHLSWVLFVGTSGDGPSVVPCVRVGRQVGLQFYHARWAPLPLAEFRALIAKEG